MNCWTEHLSLYYADNHTCSMYPCTACANYSLDRSLSRVSKGLGQIIATGLGNKWWHLQITNCSILNNSDEMTIKTHSSPQGFYNKILNATQVIQFTHRLYSVHTVNTNINLYAAWSRMNTSNSLCSASYVSCQRDSSPICICCWAPCCRPTLQHHCCRSVSPVRTALSSKPAAYHSRGRMMG